MHLDARERWILENAEHFVACAFRGRGVYERIQCACLEEARDAAQRLSTDRGAMIYAVRGHSQALVETVGPRVTYCRR